MAQPGPSHTCAALQQESSGGGVACGVLPSLHVFIWGPFMILLMLLGPFIIAF